MKRDQFDNLNLWRPMTCPVCTACFQDMVTLRREGRVRCYFGGPFSGYVTVR